MKLDIATLEAFLNAERGIRRALPPTSIINCADLKRRVADMTNEEAADLCRWVQGLSDAARVLRSLSFELPTE